MALIIIIPAFKDVVTLSSLCPAAVCRPQVFHGYRVGRKAVALAHQRNLVAKQGIGRVQDCKEQTHVLSTEGITGGNWVVVIFPVTGGFLCVGWGNCKPEATGSLLRSSLEAPRAPWSLQWVPATVGSL